MTKYRINILPSIKEIRSFTGLSQSKFAAKYGGIPVKTLQNWEIGRTKPPDYVISLIWCVVQNELNHKALQEAELRKVEERMKKEPRE